MRLKMDLLVLIVFLASGTTTLAQSDLEALLVHSEIFSDKQIEDVSCNSTLTACAACSGSSCAVVIATNNKVFDLSPVEQINIGKIGKNRTISTINNQVLGWTEELDGMRVEIETTIYSGGVRYRAQEAIYINPKSGPMWR